MNVSRVNEHAQKIKNIKKAFRDAYPPHLWKKGNKHYLSIQSHYTTEMRHPLQFPKPESSSLLPQFWEFIGYSSKQQNRKRMKEVRVVTLTHWLHSRYFSLSLPMPFEQMPFRCPEHKELVLLRIHHRFIGALQTLFKEKWYTVD